MPYETLSLGLTLTLPTTGTKNWGPTLKATTWTKISAHQHTGAGDGAQLVANSLADYIIGTTKLDKNYGVTQAPALAPVGTTEILDFLLGRAFFLDVSGASGDVSLTLSNPAAGTYYFIWITQGATPRNVLWPASVKWPQGVAPILSTVNGSVDYVFLYYTGTVFRGTWELDFK